MAFPPPPRPSLADDAGGRIPSIRPEALHRGGGRGDALGDALLAGRSHRRDREEVVADAAVLEHVEGLAERDAVEVDLVAGSREASREGGAGEHCLDVRVEAGDVDAGAHDRLRERHCLVDSLLGLEDLAGGAHAPEHQRDADA